MHLTEPIFEDLIQNHAYCLTAEGRSPRTIDWYAANLKRFPQKQIQDFVYIDHRHDVAIVATVPEDYGENIIAVGRYYLNENTNRAEVAFVVHDDWQNRGIGTFLLKYLITIARRNGIAGFTAEVLRDNKPMQAVFHKSGCHVSSSLNDGAYSFELDFP